MALTRWMPSANGRLLTSTALWFLDIDDSKYRLWLAGKEHVGDILELEDARFTPGFYFTTIRLRDPFTKDRYMPVVDVDGIPNEEAIELKKLIALATATKRQRELASALQKHLPPALAWLRELDDKLAHAVRTRGWVTTEFIRSVGASKPQGLVSLLSAPGIADYIAAQPSAVRECVTRLQQGLPFLAQAANEKHEREQLERYKDFFEKVERSPLSEEQAKAVVCFDSRVLLVASAGSGKTSTMVAKAGYALKSGYCAPDRMLLMAFNNDAAAELRERLKHRLEPLGLPVEQIAAKTFHAFGLDALDSGTVRVSLHGRLSANAGCWQSCG